MAVLPNTADPGGSNSAPHAYQKRELSAGASAGIGVGVGALFMLFVIFACVICSRRKRKATPPKGRQASVPLAQNPPWVNTTEPPKQLTSDQILGIDKQSLLRDIPTQEAAQSSHLVAAPAHLDDSKYDYSKLGCPTRLPEQGVNPWEIEYHPNPVIFPHLADAAIDDNITVSKASSSGGPAQASSSASPREEYELDAVETKTTRLPAPGIQNVPHAWEVTRGNRTMTALERDVYYHSPCMEDSMVRSANAPAAGRGSASVSPNTVLESTSSADIPMVPRRDSQPPSYDIVNTIPAPAEGSPATVSTELSSNSGSSLVQSSTQSSATTSSSSAATSSSPTSTDDTVPLQGSAIQQYSCPDCHLQFRTQGLRRTHVNRKHNFRYTCSLCPAAFGLQADLKRHRRTVHKETFGTETRFYCPNVGCATPERSFNRKDNYSRHVERCWQTIAKGKGPALTPPG